MEENLRRTKVYIITAIMLAGMLPILLAASQTVAWSNGGYSADPSNPDYGTHDWIAEHALDWLPSNEKQYILSNLQDYLYGTELPDNGGAPDGIGDSFNHHVYYYSSGNLQDGISATRAQQAYEDVIDHLNSGNDALAAKYAGVMSHYIVDLAVFGHVMGSSTDWGAETHHSDYENYVRDRTTSYMSSMFDPYLAFDGALFSIDAYDAALDVAYSTTFGDGADIKSCTWMDSSYDWLDPAFKDSAGASLNRAANTLADVLHTIAVAAPSGDVTPPSILSTTPASSDSNVQITQDVVVRFSEAMDTTSFDFTIDPYVGGWTWTWNAGDTKITGTRDDFAFSITYTFTVSGADDVNGNPLATTPYAWTWTTEAELTTTGTIAGTVQDKEGNPLEGAVVQLKDVGTGNIVDAETADPNGVFEFFDVPFGSYTVLVSREGYVGHETMIFSVSEGTPTIDIGEIVLERGPLPKEGSQDWMWIAVGLPVGIVVVMLALLIVNRRKGPDEAGP
ncbi:MAG: carboxypeptidase regulatory-like domain-containing protein [Candidatus Thermoplasmatota archaeon]|nr:carboxypeptidase regulatory-like domain-containing protein [Candidatus Thermoplasmatota archaeon]